MSNKEYQEQRELVWNTLEAHRVQCKQAGIGADAYCEAIAAWSAFVIQEMATKDSAMLISMKHFMFALNQALEKHSQKKKPDASKSKASELELAQAQAELLKKAGALN